MCGGVVDRLCKAAKVGPFHPHQFRALMVSLFVKYTGSNGLEKGAKFLGHKNPTVTYKRYWKPNAEELIAKIPFFSMPVQPPNTSNNTNNSNISLQTLYAWEHNKRKQLQDEIAVYMQLLPKEKILEAEGLIASVRRRYKKRLAEENSIDDENYNVINESEDDKDALDDDYLPIDLLENSDNDDDPLAAFRQKSH